MPASSGPVGRHLPALRRVARALSGSRERGDALLRTALGNLLSAAPPLAEGQDLVERLYAALIAAWRAGRPGDHVAADGGFDRRLQALDPLVRAAFLLVVMEGLDEAAVAAVTGLSEAEVHRVVEEAEATVGRLQRTRVLVADPDPRSGADLIRLLGAIGHPVVGLATRAETLLAQARILRPGLLVADLAFGDAGAGAVGRILAEQAVPLVSVAGDRRAGASPDADLLVVEAPFEEAALRAAVAEALFLGGVGADA